ncbi:MAG: M23 family metallopeptidase [Tannerella sp.]|jgi:murein DD-endopeptidase MepM/ murein hydrolase activator NlpD|nr:M23 family metallopeptidase [Tannerella sp.]
MGLFNQRKVFYVYNPNLLTYERVYPSAKERFFVVLRHLSLSILIGVGVLFAFIHFFDSPMEALLRKENMLLKTQYEVLSLRINDALKVLDDIQERDDNLYRAIFQTKEIPEYIRKPGIGGTNRYDYLMNLSNTDLVIETTRKIDMMKRQLYVQSNSFDELVSIGKNLEARNRCVPAIQPLANKDLKRTSSGYGMRIDPIYRTLRHHDGMDFVAPVGTDIYATGDGTVIFAGWQQGYGNCIRIDHGFGYETMYAHNSKNLVKVRQKVVRGEIIGLVGNSGKSVGPHLHYEVLFNDKHVNPVNYYYMDLTPDEYAEMIQIAENRGQVMD